jgi:hypothetical protein
MAIENDDLIRRLPAAPAAQDSAVSWSAIFAGAAAAAGFSVLLFLLGTGLGLSLLTPWTADGFALAGIGISTIVWLAVTQLIASAAGGYIAGRLRSKWDGLAFDEVHFRDTAHGFLAWVIATLAMVVLTGTSLMSAVGGGSGLAAAGSSFVAGAATVGATAGPQGAHSGADSLSYITDTLLRENTGLNKRAGAGSDAATTDDTALVAQVGTVLARAVQAGALSADDTRYLGRIVAERNGLTQAQAEAKVTQAFAQLQAVAGDAQTGTRLAADKARKVSAFAALWTLVALLCGAFVSSYAALIGGRHRIE